MSHDLTPRSFPKGLSGAVLPDGWSLREENRPRRASYLMKAGVCVASEITRDDGRRVTHSDSSTPEVIAAINAVLDDADRRIARHEADLRRAEAQAKAEAETQRRKVSIEVDRAVLGSAHGILASRPTATDPRKADRTGAGEPRDTTKPQTQDRSETQSRQSMRSRQVARLAGFFDMRLPKKSQPSRDTTPAAAARHRDCDPPSTGPDPRHGARTTERDPKTDAPQLRYVPARLQSSDLPEGWTHKIDFKLITSGVETSYLYKDGVHVATFRDDDHGRDRTATCQSDTPATISHINRILDRAETAARLREADEHRRLMEKRWREIDTAVLGPDPDTPA